MATTLEGTRQQILDFIRREGSVTVEQLSKALGLAPATIRRHLDLLQRDQLVFFQQSRQKPGRPEFAYSLTESGHESGRRDYQRLLCLLLTSIQAINSESEGEEGQELLDRLLNQVSHQLSEPYLLALDSKNLDARTTNLERALNDIGFAPEFSRQDQHLTIRLCNCPYRAAALCQGSVCSIDHRLISNILGAEPCRESSIRDGDRVCSYTVQLSGKPL